MGFVHAWETVSGLALLPMLLWVPRYLSFLHVSRRDPSRFAGGFRSYKIHTFTGYASDVSKGGGIVDTGGATFGNFVADQFFLTDDRGEVESFQLHNFNAAIAPGNLVSVAWVQRRRGKTKNGVRFLVYNHTTRQSVLQKRALLNVVQDWPNFYLYPLMILILPLLFIILIGIWTRLQLALVGTSSFKPLIASLEANAPVRANAPARPISVGAAAGPAPGSNGVTGISSELKELTSLRDSGALSEDQFEAAKAKLLAP